MSADLDSNTIEEWLDPNVVSDYQCVESSGGMFNISVVLSGLNLHVARDKQGEPLRVIGKLDFDSETLALLLDRNRTRRELQTQLTAVIAGTSAVHTCLNDDGEFCPFEEMRSIQFEHRIYNPEIDQHTVMTSLLEIAKLLNYLSDVVSGFRDRLDENR